MTSASTSNARATRSSHSSYGAKEGDRGSGVPRVGRVSRIDAMKRVGEKIGSSVDVRVLQRNI